MSAHRIPNDLNRLYSTGGAVIEDPGANGTFSLEPCQWGGIASIASGNRALPNAPKGTLFFVCATGSVGLTPNIATLESGDVAICFADTDSSWKAIVLSSGAENFAGSLDNVVADLTGETPLDELTSETTFSGVLNQLYATLPNAQFTTSSTVTSVTPAAGALTGAKHVYWQNTADGALTLTPRTATQLFGDTPAAYVGMSYLLTIVNRGDNTVTLGAASGITYTGEQTIATLVTRTYVVTFTSATEATIVSVSKGTIET